MIGHMMDLISSGQFHIITYPEVDFSFIICHLTYLIFSIDFPNQLFKSTYAINPLIKLMVLLAYNTLLSLTNVRT